MSRLFVPFGAQVIVQREEFKYISDSGKIIIPKTAESKPTIGTIIGVGPEVTKVKLGDVVLFTHMSGTLFSTKDPTNPRAHPDTGMVEWLFLDETELKALVLQKGEGEEASITGKEAYARD